MQRTTKTAVKMAALTASALIASAGVANASVTIDSNGKGFVGKGDVQTALGLNNSALQKAADVRLASTGLGSEFIPAWQPGWHARQ